MDTLELIQKPFLSTEQFVKDVIEDELEIFRKLDLKNKLLEITKRKEGLKLFAEVFYFVRYDFCKINFIVGSRSFNHEFYWKGLAINLYEEAGGEHGKSHNELYRDFLKSVGARKEEYLVEPQFAKAFNKEWEDFSYNAPFLTALAAIGIYEIFDNPDYQLLWELVQESGVDKEGQLFFKVHAGVEHFEMFESVVDKLSQSEEGILHLKNAKDFVFRTQTEMWCELLNFLEA